MKADWRISPRIGAPNRIRDWKKPLLRFGVAVLWIALWQAASMAVGLELVLPSPISCVKALFGLFPEGGFWLSVLGSVRRIAVGYVIGCVVGAAVGAAAYFIPAVGELLKPIMSIVRTAPVASFILLAVLWMSSDGVPMLISALMVIPIVYGNTYAGLKEHSAELREVAFVYGFSRRQCFLRLFIPAVKPYFSAGCMTSLGLAWKAGVAAEVLVVTDRSVGEGLYLSKIYLETPQLFAWTAVVILLSYALEKLIKLVARRFSEEKLLSGLQADKEGMGRDG